MRSDVLVVGAGVAGLRTALALAPLSVTLITKSVFGKGGSSPLAQGGIAAAVSAEDSWALHAQDTVEVGGELCDRRVVESLTRDAAAQIGTLRELGVRFDRSAEGEVSLAREAGHCRRRILQAGGDAIGSELMRALGQRIREAPHVRVLERVFAADLLWEGGRVSGVAADPGSGRHPIQLQAAAVVLATGGLGQLYRCTTNPVENTADGVAMAARAGAALVDLEFVQFHPTALRTDRDPLPLLTEALRGAGATIIDERGEHFLRSQLRSQIGPAEMAPRDRLTAAIWRHQQARHEVFLDLRSYPGPALSTHFPTAHRACIAAGVDPASEPVPITPATHYSMGGIQIDARGRTSLPGLWACGEVAASGAHGANRLASNSLLEAAVFGAAIARDLRESIEPYAPDQPLAPSWSGRWTGSSQQPLRSALRDLMWTKVGICRDEEGLEGALETISGWQTETTSRSGELCNLLTVAHSIALAALERRESRGCHRRTDHPSSRESMRRRLPIVDGALARLAVSANVA